MWRSSGTFIIDATNNKIDFKEGGPELHATIASGTYIALTLAAQIKTQLQTAGAQTYTVTWSTTTGLWTILSSGSSFSLMNNTGVNQATAALKIVCGFANSDRTGALTYTGSNIAIHTEESVVFDLQTTEDINSAILLWSKEDGIRLSSAAVVKIQANATNTWASPAVNTTLTIDDVYNTATNFYSTNQSYRYWRVLIIDPTNANLFVDLGVVILGLSESISTADNGFKYNISDNNKITETDFGNQYVDEYPQTANLSLNFALLDYADIATIETAYKTNGTKKPVFIAMDETGAVYSKNHFSIYGKMKSNLDIGHINYDMFNTTLEIREVV
jgi:hypothetical protein